MPSTRTAPSSPSSRPTFRRLAEQIALDHLDFEAHGRPARRAGRSAGRRRRADGPPPWSHGLYLDLAAFTEHATSPTRTSRSARSCPPCTRLLGPDAILGVHQQIVGSIPPDEMARSLAVMLPAMNVDDRAELLGGMQAGAPAEVFAEVWGLACSVLHPQDADAVARRPRALTADARAPMGAQHRHPAAH